MPRDAKAAISKAELNKIISAMVAAPRGRSPTLMKDQGCLASSFHHRLEGQKKHVRFQEDDGFLDLQELPSERIVALNDHLELACGYIDHRVEIVPVEVIGLTRKIKCHGVEAPTLNFGVGLGFVLKGLYGLHCICSRMIAGPNYNPLTLPRAAVRHTIEIVTVMPAVSPGQPAGFA